MKKLITYTLLLLLFTITRPLMAQAAPIAALSLSPDRHFVYLKFSGLKDVAKLSYTLTYDTTRGQKGFAGGLKTTRSTRSSSRRQLLGTSSSGYNSYHSGVKNLQLEVTYTLRSGGTTSATQSLP